MKKTLKIPAQLFRSGTAQVGTDGSLTLSISSDTPCKRYDYWNDEDYYEVLEHDADGMDDTRLKAGTALLFNHDRDIQLGTISAPEIRNGKCYVTAKLSDAEDTKSYRTRITEGVLKDTSVGYQITDDGECVGAKDGCPIYKFKWAPYEASMVTIPADISVGVGRTREAESKSEMREISVETKDIDKDSNKSHTHQQPNKPMADTTTPPEKPEVKIDVVAERANARAEYKKEVKKIDDFVKALKIPEWKVSAEKIAEKHKDKDEPNFAEFHIECVPTFDGVKRLDQETAKVGLDANSIRRFSMVKAIRELSTKDGLTGLEKEVCTFAAEQYYQKDGREFQGACIPSDITDARAEEVLDLNQRGMENLAWEMRRLNQQLGRTMNASTFTAGGFLVGTELLAGSYIDYLRNARLIGKGPFGIIELTGLVGNIAIPKQTTTATTYWLPEGGSVTKSDFAGSQLYLTPHRLACASSWTKQLLMQSTPSVEMLVRNDQAQAVGVELDRVTYNGSGASGEPIGIVNTTGIDASVTFSGNWTQPKSLAFTYAIENANANTIGEQVYVTSPLTKSYAMGTVQVTSSTFPIYIWMPSKGEFATIAGSQGGVVNGYGAWATKQLGNRVLYGIYNNNVINAMWGGFDLMVEPYTGAATETINSWTNLWADVGLRYPQAFSYSTDAPTSP